MKYIIIRSDNDTACQWDGKTILFTNVNDVTFFINTFPSFFQVGYIVKDISNISDFNKENVINFEDINSDDFKEEIEDRS